MQVTILSILIFSCDVFAENLSTWIGLNDLISGEHPIYRNDIGYASGEQMFGGLNFPAGGP
jgi:hypothetical protein